MPTTVCSAELSSLLSAKHALVPDSVELLSGGLTELAHVLLLQFIQTTDLFTQLPSVCVCVCVCVCVLCVGEMMIVGDR